MIVERNQEQNKERHPFHEVSDQLETYDEPHYRLYLSKNSSEPTIVNMQSHDYHDPYYEPERFLDDKAYKDEEQAEVAAKLFNDEGAPEELKQKYSLAERKSDSQAGKSSHSAFQDVADQLPSYDAAHYRVYLSTRTGKPTVVNVQYFDYNDYKGSHFLDRTAYATEEEAQ